MFFNKRFVLASKSKSRSLILSNNRLKFIKKDEVEHTFSFDAGPVYPGYYFGHEKELSKVNAKLGMCTNFYFTGSLAEYAYSDLQVLTAKSIDLASELATINNAKSSEILKDTSITKPSTNFNFGNFENFTSEEGISIRVFFSSSKRW